MKNITFLFFFIYFILINNKIFAEPIKDDSFPKNFTSGILHTGVDCEHIEFFPTGKFVYKFTGDCKGWGRKLKGTWKKEKQKILLSATLMENKNEGEVSCAGSYYHENTLSEKRECFKKYKNRIKENFGVFPAIFDVSGYVWISDKGNIGVNIQSYLRNNPKKEKVKGFMFFDDADFGKFSDVKFK